MLRSPSTDEYDLLSVVGDWQVWVGTIGKAEVSITGNKCRDDSDCNLNGKCTDDGKCNCDSEDGVCSSSLTCGVIFLLSNQSLTLWRLILFLLAGSIFRLSLRGHSARPM